MLHPVRLRIARALEGRQATTAELRDELPDVRRATLYHHLKLLLDAGVIEVTAERPVRGVVERVYGLREFTHWLNAAALDRTGPAAAAHVLRTFAALVQGDVERYLAHGDANLAADRITFHTESIDLSDEETDDLRRALLAIISSRAGRPPRNRRPRVVSLSILPGRPSPGGAGAPPRADALLPPTVPDCDRRPGPA